MLNSKFVKLLRTLSPVELGAFWKHVRVVYGGQKVALDVLGFVLKDKPYFSNKTMLDKGNAAQKLFKTRSGKNAERISNALSDLYKWLKEFLIAQKLYKDPTAQLHAWASILLERRQTVEYQKFVRKAVAKKQSVALLNSTGLWSNQHLHHDLYYYIDGQLKKPNTTSLMAGNQLLDMYYVVSKLKSACEMAIVKHHASPSFDERQMNTVLEMASDKRLPKNILVDAYRNLYLLIAQGADEKYPEIELQLTALAKNDNKDDMWMVIHYLNNHAAMKIRMGEVKYWQLIHKVNQFGISNSIFNEGGFMNCIQFNNIANAGVKALAFDWVGAFIPKYAKLLEPDYRKTYIQIAWSILHFEQGNFKKVVERLNNLDVPHPFEKIRAKSLLLRSLFELKIDLDVSLELATDLEQLLKSFPKPHPEAVSGTLNFVRLFRELIRERLPKDQLEAKVKSVKPLYFSDWLMLKMKGYKERFATPTRGRRGGKPMA